MSVQSFGCIKFVIKRMHSPLSRYADWCSAKSFFCLFTQVTSQVAWSIKLRFPDTASYLVNRMRQAPVTYMNQNFGFKGEVHGGSNNTSKPLASKKCLVNLLEHGRAISSMRCRGKSVRSRDACPVAKTLRANCTSHTHVAYFCTHSWLVLQLSLRNLKHERNRRDRICQ